MEYNLVFYFSAPSLMQLGDGIGKMVLTRHPVFSAAAHQSRQTVQSNLYASSSPNNQHSKPVLFFWHYQSYQDNIKFIWNIFISQRQTVFPIFSWGPILWPKGCRGTGGQIGHWGHWAWGVPLNQGGSWSTMSSHISEAHCKREQRAVMRQLTANLNSILLGHGDAPGSDHYGLCKVIPPLYLLSLSWNIGILIILLLFML